MVAGGWERVVEALAQSLPVSARVVDSSFRQVFVAGRGLTSDVLDPAFAHVQPLYEGAFEGNPGQRQFGIFNRQFEIRVEPLRVQDGRVQTVLAISWDVTGLAAREKNAPYARPGAGAGIAALKDDLRQALSAMLGGERRRMSPEASQQARAVVQRRVEQLKRLTDNLIEAAGLLEGTIDPRRGRVDLRDIVLQSVDAVSPFMKQHTLHFGFDMPDDPIWLQGDAARLQQALVHVLMDAKERTPDGGRILLQLITEGPDAVMIVRDSGPAVAPSVLPGAFQVSDQPGDGDGMDIGLEIARHMIERHGGRMTTRSMGAGYGSELTIRLTTVAGRPDTL